MSAPPVRLTVEVGTHLGPVRDVAVDPQGSLFATCGDDGTVRVWQLADGAPVVTLRPRLATFWGGVDSGWATRTDGLTRLAFSPDGRWLAAAGRSLFRFARPGFELTDALLPRDANAARNLAFSADGGTLYRAGGGDASVFDCAAADLHLVAEISRCSRLEVDGRGRRLRVFGNDELQWLDEGPALRRSSARLHDEHRPALAVSPRGLVALQEEALGIRLLEGSDLAPGPLLRLPALEADHQIQGLAFVGDGGLAVSTGGSPGVPGPHRVHLLRGPDHALAWSRPVASALVSALVGTAGGEVLWASLGGAFGLLGADGVPRFARAPSRLDFTHAGERFAIDERGATVQLDDGRWFLVPERRLRPTRPFRNQSPPDLALPDRDDKLLSFHASWLGRVWSHHRTADKALLYGLADLLLIGVRYDPRTSGWEWRGSTSLSTLVLALNESRDGRFLVVGLADGTVRWLRPEDGSEQLALFVHPDGRWVLWTPSGYYDAAPGAVELLRELSPQGDRYLALPASARPERHRPEVIDRILDRGSEAAALDEAPPARAAAIAPPVVSLAELEDGAVVGTTPLAVRVRVDGGGRVQRLWALVDGQEAATTRRLEEEEAAPPGAEAPSLRELVVALPERDCTLTVIARSEGGESEPLVVRLRWRSGDPSDHRPRLLLLAVGVSRYRRVELTLRYAAKDAADFAAALAAGAKELYSQVESRLLTDEKASRAAILEGLDWLAGQATDRDVVVIFFAGHGLNDGDGQYQFLPWDADPALPRRSFVPAEEVQGVLTGTGGWRFLFLDSCHSGNVVVGPGRAELLDPSRMLRDLAGADGGVWVFAATSGQHTALEDPQWQNGAFTRALVEAFSGAADFDHEGRLTASAVDLYLARRVPELTSGGQRPTSAKPQAVTDVALLTRPRG